MPFQSCVEGNDLIRFQSGNAVFKYLGVVWTENIDTFTVWNAVFKNIRLSVYGKHLMRFLSGTLFSTHVIRRMATNTAYGDESVLTLGSTNLIL